MFRGKLVSKLQRVNMFVYVLFVAAAFCAVEGDSISDAYKNCVSELGYTEEQVSGSLKSSNLADTPLGCVSGCFLKKMELMDSKFKVNTARVHEIFAESGISADKADAVLACGAAQPAPSSECGAGAIAYTCLKQILV